MEGGLGLVIPFVVKMTMKLVREHCLQLVVHSINARLRDLIYQMGLAGVTSGKP